MSSFFGYTIREIFIGFLALGFCLAVLYISLSFMPKYAQQLQDQKGEHTCVNFVHTDKSSYVDGKYPLYIYSLCSEKFDKSRAKSLLAVGLKCSDYTDSSTYYVVGCNESCPQCIK